MSETLWNTVFEAADVGSMVDKYGWLARGPLAPAVLREAARRWPGSLREHQRVSPPRYRERARWAQEGLVRPDRGYGAWLAEGRAAICLWSELHRRTAEVLAWRAAASAPRRRDPAAFLRDLTQRDPRRRAAWPSEALVPSQPAGLGMGWIEACVAVRAGWDLAALRRCLLDLPAP